MSLLAGIPGSRGKLNIELAQASNETFDARRSTSRKLASELAQLVCQKWKQSKQGLESQKARHFIHLLLAATAASISSDQVCRLQLVRV